MKQSAIYRLVRLYYVIPCDTVDRTIQRSGIFEMDPHEVTDDAVARYKANNDADLVVDPDELEKVIESLLACRHTWMCTRRWVGLRVALPSNG
jgi:hypothetical protein